VSADLKNESTALPQIAEALVEGSRAEQRRKKRRKVLDYQYKIRTRFVRRYDAVFITDFDVNLRGMVERSHSGYHKQNAA
jgi:hypothetical protein